MTNKETHSYSLVETSERLILSGVSDYKTIGYAIQDTIRLFGGNVKKAIRRGKLQKHSPFTEEEASNASDMLEYIRGSVTGDF